MPDIQVCNSTVCSIRSNCERNWDSRVHVPDRDVKLQAFIPQNELGGVGYGPNAKTSECRWYMPVSLAPVITIPTGRWDGGFREFRQSPDAS